jgi:hypothetical protein
VRRARKPLLLVDDVAFHESDGLARMNHFRLRLQLRVPYRTQKIDFQFQGREALALGEGTAVSCTHRRIGDIA